MRLRIGPAVFGSFDGLTSVLGIVAALFAAPLHVLVAAALGLALSSSVGMSAGQYLGDERRSLASALLMGGSTLVGTLIPVVPFLLFTHAVALVVASVLVIIFGVVVSEARFQTHTEPSRIRAYLETFVVLALALGVAVVGSLLGGS